MGGILLLYCLAIGPVARFTVNTPLEDAAERLYEPIFSLAETPAWPVIIAYARLWGINAGYCCHRPATPLSAPANQP